MNFELLLLDSTACPYCFWKVLLMMLIPFLLGLLLGYWLWYKYKSRVEELESERDRLKAKLTDMEKDLASLRYQHDELKKDNETLRVSLHKCEANNSVLKTKLLAHEANILKLESEISSLGSKLSIAAAAAGAGGKKKSGYESGFTYNTAFKNDELQIIEGIGPKIEQLLKGGGYTNWGLLAEADTDDLKKVLSDAGLEYQLYNIESWKIQAGLANDGKWKELVDYQKSLDSPMSVGYAFLPSKVEKMYDELNIMPGVEGRDIDLGTLAMELDELETANDALRYSMGQYASERVGLKEENLRLTAELAALTAASADSAVGRGMDEVAAVSMGTVFEEDNLQIIEGVGPKIEGLLKDAGYTTWSAIAASSYDDLKKVLDDAGPSYRIHEPKSWSRQAKLAHEGKWDDLVEYQKHLDSGRGDKGDFDTPSKVEKLFVQFLGFTNKADDLKIVEGIGPKIEKLLKDAGINNWEELSNAATEKIQEILDAAGSRYRLADPSTWARQAGLAHQGKWDELKTLQDILDGGKE